MSVFSYVSKSILQPQKHRPSVYVHSQSKSTIMPGSLPSASLSIPYTIRKQVWFYNLRGKTLYSLLFFFSAVRVHLKILEILAFFKHYICDMTFTRSCNIPPRFYRFSSFHVEFSYYLSQSKFKIRFL